MGMPMPPMGQMSQQEQEGPITMEMIMALRNAARGQSDRQGAAQRRLERNQEGPPEMDTDPQTGVLAEGQSPEEIMLNDLQEQMDAEIEPPEISNTAADVMMRYGAIQEYLMRARGEIPNG